MFHQVPVVQSVVSLTKSLRVISLTVLADLIYNILIFLQKLLKFFSANKFQHICVSLDVNFNESLTNDIVRFEQVGPDCYLYREIFFYCLYMLSFNTILLDLYHSTQTISSIFPKLNRKKCEIAGHPTLNG